MKATGIVRRIDDLGRVVVPKEIRRTLKIREGDPIEIFTEKDGEIILRKYSQIGEMSEYAKQYADTLAHISGHIVIITDKNSIVAVSGAGKKDTIGKPITKELYGIIEKRNLYITGNNLPAAGLSAFPATPPSWHLHFRNSPDRPPCPSRSRGRFPSSLCHTAPFRQALQALFRRRRSALSAALPLPR